MTTTDVQTTTERWAYAGQREAVKRGQLSYAWVPYPGDPERGDTFHHFAKVKGAVIGGVYEVAVERTDDGVTVFGRAAYTGKRADAEFDVPAETITEWTAADAANRTAVDMAKRQSADARNDDFKDLCAPLRALVRKQIGTTRRAGLIAAIIAEVSR